MSVLVSVRQTLPWQDAAGEAEGTYFLSYLNSARLIGRTVLQRLEGK